MVAATQFGSPVVRSYTCLSARAKDSLRLTGVSGNGRQRRRRLRPAASWDSLCPGATGCLCGMSRQAGNDDVEFLLQTVRYLL